MLGIIIAILVLILVVWLLVKKFTPQPVLLLGGILLMLFTVIFGLGTVLPAHQTTHFEFFDIFKAISTTMSSQLAGLGLTLMAIAGFSRYMEHVGASQSLFAIFEKPLGMVKSKYSLLVVSFFVTQILVIFIPSHAGLGLLLMVTLYPILIRTGVSKLSAMGVIATCQFIDHGPGSGNVIFASHIAHIEPAVYFIKYQLPVTIPIIICVAIAHFFAQRYWDKKEGFVANQDEIKKQDKAEIPPLSYAILPVIPLILIICFSPLCHSPISIDVTTAMIISTIVAIIFEYFRLKNFHKVLDSFMLFFEGMGKQFILVVSLIICGQVFANGLIDIGVIDTFIHYAQSAGWGVATMIVIMSIILALAAFIMGSGNAAFFSFGALIPRIASFLHADVITLILPMQIMTSFGRTVSPITAAIVAIAGIGGVSPFQVVKRTAIPVVVAIIVNFAMTFIYMYI